MSYHKVKNDVGVIKGYAVKDKNGKLTGYSKLEKIIPRWTEQYGFATFEREGKVYLQETAQSKFGKVIQFSEIEKFLHGNDVNKVIAAIDSAQETETVAPVEVKEEDDTFRKICSGIKRGLGANCKIIDAKQRASDGGRVIRVIVNNETVKVGFSIDLRQHKAKKGEQSESGKVAKGDHAELINSVVTAIKKLVGLSGDSGGDGGGGGDDTQRNLFGLFKKQNEDEGKLTESEIEYLRGEILKIGADPDKFRFNQRNGIIFVDHECLIYINKVIFSEPGSQPPEYDLSIRAILAHEYWGHLKNYPSPFEPDSPEDESWADDSAARNSPGLTDEDRTILFRRSLAFAQRARNESNVGHTAFNISVDDMTRRYLSDDEICKLTR